MVNVANKKSANLKDLRMGAVWRGTNLIWSARKACLFDEENITTKKEQTKWNNRIQETAFLSKPYGEVKNNSDGASKGNPGKGGVGYIIRDNQGNVLRTCLLGLGVVTSYKAECRAIVEGKACAASNGWLLAWVEADSAAVVMAFNTGNIPWLLLNGWNDAVKT
ncbi:hypothetical protein GIB67_009158 [Kingdonia uniflora]|uniref:RNase H type-1 domain-containing protein n=1 Tax=Kingdonia uniflora TaxID=39325 RepID=A0A7J7N247_9MAGN|nr:hypothetical protein GIB67_009158 [Kingdonia uniflora]